MAFKPVSGSSIASTKVWISLVNVLIISFFVSMSAFVTFRSSSHQALCCVSFSPSALSKESIFSISWSTTAKGLFARSREAMRPKAKEPCTLASLWRNSCAARRGAAESALAEAAAAKRCRRMVARRVCTKAGPVAPVDVASTVPKVAKAASLLRMAMASERAVSSLVLRATRSSYCFFFAAHISESFSRKSSASAFAAVATSSWPRFVDKSPSLPPSSLCFVL
mmetsp:Transcript_103408/g.299128  ORF Transcript_103408/g.299128 Transcript_103408/m.299128 type:complete len:224 (-) Transcript_103408:314-985(-)